MKNKKQTDNSELLVSYTNLTDASRNYTFMTKEEADLIAFQQRASTLIYEGKFFGFWGDTEVQELNEKWSQIFEANQKILVEKYNYEKYDTKDIHYDVHKSILLSDNNYQKRFDFLKRQIEAHNNLNKEFLRESK